MRQSIPFTCACVCRGVDLMEMHGTAGKFVVGWGRAKDQASFKHFPVVINNVPSVCTHLYNPSRHRLDQPINAPTQTHKAHTNARTHARARTHTGHHRGRDKDGGAQIWGRPARQV